jgi:glutamate-1-semialdehyde aminotransferase
MRAGLAALEELEKPGVYQKLEEKTSLLVEALRQMMHDLQDHGLRQPTRIDVYAFLWSLT